MTLFILEHSLTFVFLHLTILVWDGSAWLWVICYKLELAGLCILSQFSG